MTPDDARFLLESAGWSPEAASAIVYELMLRDTALTTERLTDANNAARRVLVLLGGSLRWPS